MRVQTEEWRRFIPGVRMYKGKMTLFWNGQPLGHNQEERLTWQVIIILPGVEIIPEETFLGCRNVKTVTMANTVRRIGRQAFSGCKSLVFVKFSINLEYIGDFAFSKCLSLTSIFIPPSCREIGNWAFRCCEKLIILSVPQHTQLRVDVIAGTALIKASQFHTDSLGEYANTNEVNEWIRNRHADNQFSLHRACASYNPLGEVIFNIVQTEGPRAFNKPDSVGVTPSQYLSENPFTEIKEHNIIKRFILEMTGEVV